MSVLDTFGCMAFGDEAMKKYLSEPTYLRLKKTIDEGKSLAPEIADEVAEGMKSWATALGATHYTHWFQPMTEVTAEKHDSFLSFDKSGNIIEEFSGKSLIKGEPDASSVPSGGIRATFEARGYTAWDATSYAFVKENTLYIPTAFCSYGGEALDKKTPLLRSMELISRQALRIMRLFGNDDVKKVFATVGAEQEYFLIDKSLYDKRMDLVFTGRTLFGAKPPKGQELDDHYYGSIKPRVKAFMTDLDNALWKLGIPVKTEHNEAAPSQHELAVLYTTANIATDNNQLVMETMKKTANSHGLACILTEKPFKAVNGSGKHNNWSLSTDKGTNLLEPGETPDENAQFLLFITAVITAIDRRQDLFRIAASSAGNDHRLGSCEAPPAIMSVFLGEELTEILSALESDVSYNKKERPLMRVGVHTLPRFPRDATDRNRTAPIAFTGNKFEFRTPGASMSIADINTVINTSVAEALDEFATALEGAADFNDTLHEIIRRAIKEHKRIIFNGNSYGEDWQAEARSRGLLNLPHTPEAAEKLIEPKNIAFFSKYGIFSETEVRARYDIMLENYSKKINIEAHTMLEMANRQIIPSIIAFTSALADTANKKILLSEKTSSDFDCRAERNIVARLSSLLTQIYSCTEKLRADTELAENITDIPEKARFSRDTLLSDMDSLRTASDGAEVLTADEYRPFPDYSQILFGI